MPLFKKNDLKQNYTDKIPERLLPEQFQVHQTFRHGFPYQPSCLTYDCVQKLLAIGSHSGAIAIIGQSGLENHCQLASGVGALQLQFVQNKGLIVCRCTNNTLTLISIRDRRPLLTHSLEFQRENTSHIYCPYGSDWLYVGMEEGNVYVVNVMEFQLSGYTIYWDKVVDGLRKSRPGDVLSIEEHPLDNSKILIAYTGGLCALWNIKNKSVEKRFHHDTSKSMAILMSVSWHGSGKSFSAAYSDGSICMFNIKNEGKPVQIETPHGVPASNSPISQLKIFYTEPEPWTIFTGGHPEFDGSGIKTLTLQTSQQKHLMSFNDSIIDFICLPTSPFASDHQKTFSLAILTHNEILLHDLQTPGIPNFNVPLSFDIHRSPVTSIVYAGNCPDDFIAQLHSVKSKLPHHTASTKQWPLRGGKWGQESPDPWTDLIVTGHLDGTVRIWFCRSVIMQPLFTLSTLFYFNNNSSPNGSSPNSSHREPKRNISTQSIPEEKEKDTPTESTPILSPPIVVTTPPGIKILKDEPDSTPPITRSISTPEKSSPKLSERKSVESKERKSVFKKIKKSSKTPKNKKKSLAVSDSHAHDDEVDGDSCNGDNEDEASGRHTPPQATPSKPKDLPLLETGAMSQKRRTKSAFHRKTSTDSLKAVTPDEGPLSSSSSTSLKSPEDYVVVSLINSSVAYKKSEELAVHQISMCPYARHLCVSNISGHVMVFHFSVSPSDSKPQSLWINMLRDSVIIDETLPDETKQRFTTSLLFDNELSQQLPGFYIRQHCFCYKRGEGAAICPVDVTALKYWEQSELLAIGTDSGLVIINTSNNQVLQTLGTLTSILYLADPNTYSKQVRKITSEHSTHKLRGAGTCPDFSLMEKKLSIPLIIPSMELPHMDSSPAMITSPGSAPSLGASKVKVRKQSAGAVPGDQLVTCIELVKFFLTKTKVPSTTLWVATYSGHISVYTIDTVISRGKPTTEIHPTGLIIERKSPVVELHFLSEWGEQLVSPYKSQKEDNGESIAILRRRQTAKEINDTEKPVNYVTMVTKDSVRTVGFPGNHLISQIDVHSGGVGVAGDAHIVQSGLFTCESLPCLLTLISDGLILIHTLPGLKPMLRYQYESLNNSRALYTFRISGNGQALHQISPSQFQRLSVTKHDNLNLPLSLPEMYLPIESPTHIGKGVLNQLLGAITTPTATDKEKIFGVEAAGKAWKSVAKRDELLAHKETVDGEKKGGKRGGKKGGATAMSNGGASNAFTQAREKLDQRGKELSQIEENTEKLALEADDFASVAEKLAEKYRKKRF